MIGSNVRKVGGKAKDKHSHLCHARLLFELRVQMLVASLDMPHRAVRTEMGGGGQREEHEMPGEMDDEM
jgi:hypothetical protein